MRKLSEKQLRYLSQAVQLEEAVNPAIIRTTLMTIGATILCFTVWAGFTNIYEVARTPGEVVPSGYQQVVQHLEGGMVDKILVAEGDIVEQGTPLLEISGTGVIEDLERARARKFAILAQEERLRAYLEGRRPDLSGIDPKYTILIADQKNFFETMEGAQRQEQNIITEQISQKRALLQSLQRQMSTARENLAISADLFHKKSELHQKGYLSETKYLEAKQAINAIEGDIAQISSRITSANAEIKEYTGRYASLDLSQDDRVNERLDALIAEKTQHEEVLRKLEDRVSRLVLRSPVRGIVKGLSVNTVGSVIRAGETVLEIVPIDKELVVQVRIPPQHIGHIKPGQHVKVKLSSFDFSKFGLIDGTLDQVSATTFNGEAGDRFYQGKVRLSQNYVGKDKSNAVMPGMTVMAEIITGRKTILEYLLKPVHNSLKTAFSER